MAYTGTKKTSGSKVLRICHVIVLAGFRGFSLDGLVSFD